jgi:hypothetical protein
MELLMAFIFAIIAHIIEFVLFRWVIRLLRLQGPYERMKRWLSYKREYNKNALTRKEILRRQIIQNTDPIVKEETKTRIIELLAEKGLVLENAKKDPIYFTPLTIEWERLFLHLNPILDATIRKDLNDIYDQNKVSCIVVLPYPRSSKSRLTVGFENSLVKCLSSQITPVDFMTPAVLRERPSSQALSRTRETESILVVQPVGIKDDYLDQICRCIYKYSASRSVQILTILDPSQGGTNMTTTIPGLVVSSKVLIGINLGT